MNTLFSLAFILIYTSATVICYERIILSSRAFKHGLRPLSSASTAAGTDGNINTDAAIASKSNGHFSQTFIDQKNVLLLQKLSEGLQGNLTDVTGQYVNFCDESFDAYLNNEISSVTDTDRERQTNLGKIRFEINSARQQKLIAADKILRGILNAGDLKSMEAKLAYHLRRAEIDMPFMVILQLNIEDALLSNVEIAVQVMRHLETLITEHQDSLVSPPVRLMRLLIRTDDMNVRKQMLRQKLKLPNNVNSGSDSDSIQSESELEAPIPQNTASPQCEHIVVSAVQRWGGADVDIKEFEDTVADVLDQMTKGHSEDGELNAVEAKCRILMEELYEVVAEVDAPKVSDQCDSPMSPSTAI